MKKSKFNEDQIAFTSKHAELGTSVEEVCRRMRRLRQLEEEKLKQIVVDLSLDRTMLQSVVAKNR